MNLEEKINEYVTQIPEIAPSQNFWLNRTNGGEYFDEFSKEKIIGLNYSEIHYEKLNEFRERFTISGRNINYKAVKKQISDYIFDANSKVIRETFDKNKLAALKTSLTKTSNQIYNFAFEVKKGDFIVVPSKNSSKVKIGRVLNSEIDSPGMLPLQRKVEWVKTLWKGELDPIFFKLFFAHNAFAEINKYRNVVLRSIYDIFVDCGEANLVYNIKSRKNIIARSESAFSHYLLELTADFILEYNLPYNVDGIQTVVNLNSPGKKTFFGPKHVIWLLSVIGLLVVGGGLKSKYFDLSTPGLLPEVNQYLNQQTKRETIEKLIQSKDSLDIEEQKILIEVLKTLDKND